MSASWPLGGTTLRHFSGWSASGWSPGCPQWKPGSQPGPGSIPMLGAEAGGWTLLWGQVSSFRDGRLTKPAMSSVLGHARLPQCPRQQPESWTQALPSQQSWGHRLAAPPIARPQPRGGLKKPLLSPAISASVGPIAFCPLGLAARQSVRSVRAKTTPVLSWVPAPEPSRALGPYPGLHPEDRRQHLVHGSKVCAPPTHGPTSVSFWRPH